MLRHWLFFLEQYRFFSTSSFYKWQYIYILKIIFDTPLRGRRYQTDISIMFPFSKIGCPGFSWDVIFFLVAGVLLCFEFWVKAMLITHQCFCCCRAAFTQSHGLFDFSCSPASEVPPRHSWEGTQPGQLIQTDQNDVPYRIVAC